MALIITGVHSLMAMNSIKDDEIALEDRVINKMNSSHLEIEVTTDKASLEKAIERLLIAEDLLNLYKEVINRKQCPEDDFSRSERHSSRDRQESAWEKFKELNARKAAFEKAVKKLHLLIEEAQTQRIAEGLDRIECKNIEGPPIFIEHKRTVTTSQGTKCCCNLC